MKVAYGYNGLRQRPRFDEMVEFIKYEQPFIKYPDRRAKQLRESPYLTQLDGEGYMEMQHQQEQEMTEKETELAIRRIASESKETASLLRSEANFQSASAADTTEIPTTSGQRIPTTKTIEKQDAV